MITSKSNSLVKLIRSLKDKSNRDELSLFVAEGAKNTKEAILSNFGINCIVGTIDGFNVLSKKAPEFCKVDGENVDICRDGSKIKAEIVSDEVFSGLTGERSPQGILSLIEKPETKPLEPHGKCIFLDELQDPSNVGAIIRTAAAAGYDEIYLAHSADPFNEKAVRASMGGILKVKLYIGERQELLNFIDCPLVVADMDGEDAFTCQIGGDFCLVIGNEGNGVSSVVEERAKRKVSIPMENGMESLNAAVSAGILMYALRGQCKK